MYHIYFNINMHKYCKSFFKIKSMISISENCNINYFKIYVSITYL